jgi:hypothetical protein
VKKRKLTPTQKQMLRLSKVLSLEHDVFTKIPKHQLTAHPLSLPSRPDGHSSGRAAHKSAGPSGVEKIKGEEMGDGDQGEKEGPNMIGAHREDLTFASCELAIVGCGQDKDGLILFTRLGFCGPDHTLSTTIDTFDMKTKELKTIYVLPANVSGHVIGATINDDRTLLSYVIFL